MQASGSTSDMKYSPKRKVKDCRRTKHLRMNLLDSEGRIVSSLLPCIGKKRVTYKWLLEKMKQALAKETKAAAAVVLLEYVWWSLANDCHVCSETVYVGSYGDNAALQKRGINPLQELDFMARAKRA